MKLVAKAKPVKIRIKSGGEEHSSLDSLKMNFCIDDVRELLDGRLSRWLRQQNEILLAEEIDKFENQDLNSDDKCLEFIRLLFKEDLGSVKIASLFDLAKHWCFNDVKYKFNGESIFNRIINTDVEAAKYAYKNNILSMNWIAIFIQHEDLKDPEALYIEGKLWFDGYCNCKDIEEGYKFIKEAASYGWEEAIKFVSDKIYEKSKRRFSNVDKDKIKDTFIKSWPSVPNLERALEFATNNDEEIIISFLVACSVLYQKINWLTSKELMTCAWDLLKEYENGIMKYETKFIFTILGFDAFKKITTTGETKLKSIKNQYPPAKSLLEHGNNMILFNHHFLKLRINERLKLLITHLFDFE